jgi:Polysaccharide lyase family 8, N terminal alpha-helical domain
LLFQSSLNQTQVNSCTSILARAYGTFYEGKSFLTGSNILDVAKIGVDLALLTTNTTLITEAYGRINAQIVIEPGIMVDGIKPDGSFGQHGGLLYNGNYGKDLYVTSSLNFLHVFMPLTYSMPVPMTFLSCRSMPLAHSMLPIPMLNMPLRL